MHTLQRIHEMRDLELALFGMSWEDYQQHPVCMKRPEVPLEQPEGEIIGHTVWEYDSNLNVFIMTGFVNYH